MQVPRCQDDASEKHKISDLYHEHRYKSPLIRRVVNQTILRPFQEHFFYRPFLLYSEFTPLNCGFGGRTFGWVEFLSLENRFGAENFEDPNLWCFRFQKKKNIQNCPRLPKTLGIITDWLELMSSWWFIMIYYATKPTSLGLPYDEMVGIFGCLSVSESSSRVPLSTPTQMRKAMRFTRISQRGKRTDILSLERGKN